MTDDQTSFTPCEHVCDEHRAPGTVDEIEQALDFWRAVLAGTLKTPCGFADCHVLDMVPKKAWRTT